MKKLVRYYTYFLVVTILTVLLIISLIIGVCLEHWKLVQLLSSVCLVKGVLWIIVIIKKPSRQDIIKALIEQEACECLKEVKEKIKCAEEKVNNTQSNYDRYLNITDKKRKEDV